MIYDKVGLFFPHDSTMLGYFTQIPVTLTKTDNGIKIENTDNDGFTSHHVSINITPDLNIQEVSFDTSTDVIDGSSTRHIVEKIILQLDKNPFQDSLITGFYTLQIRIEYSAGELLKESGVSDTVYYHVFNGKFRTY